MHLFGTLEWAALDLCLSQSMHAGVATTEAGLALMLHALVLALLIKLGVSPFFFFKLELYKGLPLVPLVLYSSAYFLVFIALSLELFAYYLPTLLSVVTPSLLLFLGVSVVYMLSSLFSLFSLRNFFALSSLIGASLLLFLLISLSA